MKINSFLTFLAKLLLAIILVLLVISSSDPTGGGRFAREQELFFQALSGIVFLLGAPLCIFNFYLFMRWFVHCHVNKLPKESFHYVSGVPILGSLFVALSLKHLYSIPVLKISGFLLIFIDASGILWIVPGFLYMACRRIFRNQ